MKRIGILCASDTELKPFLDDLKCEYVTERAMLRFYEGTIHGHRIVAAYSGVGKVNAAIAAQILIDFFGVEAILNAGTAGGIEVSVHLFDTVISEQLSYHDLEDDILTQFHPWLKKSYFSADQTLLAAAKRCCAKSQYPVLFGAIVTGESFIENEARPVLMERFSPLAADMESASIAHVCHVNKLPFLSIRTITDTAEQSGIGAFEENCAKASRISAELTIALLDHIIDFSEGE
jgi:adenosylhomocysteine nucleosidase